MSEARGRFSSLEIKPAGTGTGNLRPGGAPLRDSAYYMTEGLKADLAGDHEKALNHYSAALAENPLLIDAWVAQLWMPLYLDEPPEAILWVDRALESFPNQPDLLAMKSLALLRCGFVDDARELNDAALVGGRASANVWLARGALQIAADSVAASACFKHALAAADDRNLTNLRIADLLLLNRKYADAEPYLRTVTTAWPQAAWAWYGYGLAQRAMGRGDYARVAFGKAEQLAPADVRYHEALVRKRGLLARLRNWLAKE